jgi:hypothetical protein
LGGALGEIAGPLGSIFGEVMGERAGVIFDEVLDPDKKLSSNSKAWAVVLNSSLAPFMLGLDRVIGKLFGGGHPDSESRRGFGGWAADQLENSNLQFVQNGQRADVTSLYTNKDWVYNAQARPGFAGVGAGLNALTGAGLPDGQMGSILSTNAFDDLNNLQMLLQALNVSAQDLQASLDNLYLGGDMSAKEFLAASKDVEDVYTQGIPGAIGATAEALDNLTAGGLASGRLAWDAFGDMAAEATEKGITSLEGLRADLIASGKPIEEVDKLMQAFANNGIKSLEELQNISLQQSAQLVSSLEDMGYAFEKPTEEAKELYEVIKEIQSIKDIETEYKFNMSDEDQKNLQMAYEMSHGGGGSSSGSGGGGETGGDGYKSSHGTPGMNWASGSLAFASGVPSYA